MWCFMQAGLAWPLTRPDLQRLRRNERAMIRQILSVKPENVAYCPIKRAVHLTWDWWPQRYHEREKALLVLTCWMIQSSNKDSLWHADRRKAWVRAAQDDLKDTCTYRDRHEWKLKEVDPCDRDMWRSSVRSVMHAASQLPGREPTDVDDAPASAR